MKQLLYYLFKIKYTRYFVVFYSTFEVNKTIHNVFPCSIDCDKFINLKNFKSFNNDLVFSISFIYEFKSEQDYKNFNL